MKARVPLGGMIREKRATLSRYEREVTNVVFSSLEESVAYAMREELGSAWGILKDCQGFRLFRPTGTDTPLGFVKQCPPLPPPPPPRKWAAYCGSCGGVIWAGELSCSVCGWTGAGWED